MKLDDVEKRIEHTTRMQHDVLAEVRRYESQLRELKNQRKWDKVVYEVSSAITENKIPFGQVESDLDRSISDLKTDIRLKKSEATKLEEAVDSLDQERTQLRIKEQQLQWLYNDELSKSMRQMDSELQAIANEEAIAVRDKQKPLMICINRVKTIESLLKRYDGFSLANSTQDFVQAATLYSHTAKIEALGQLVTSILQDLVRIKEEQNSLLGALKQHACPISMNIGQLPVLVSWPCWIVTYKSWLHTQRIATFIPTSRKANDDVALVCLEEVTPLQTNGISIQRSAFRINRRVNWSILKGLYCRGEVSWMVLFSASRDYNDWRILRDAIRTLITKYRRMT